jgi:hypothetical protein
MGAPQSDGLDIEVKGSKLSVLDGLDDRMSSRLEGGRAVINQGVKGTANINVSRVLMSGSLASGEFPILEPL